MKKVITRLFTLCLALICAAAVLIGCEPKPRDVKEVIGVYVLKQMRVIYTDGTDKVHEVDYENNENEMLKELSKRVCNYYNDRYELSKSSDYVFRKLRYNAEVDNYVTVKSMVVTPEWNSANNYFILKEENYGDWHYISFRDGSYYYAGPQWSVNNTDLEVEEFRDFMQENDIRSISLRYFLEK